MPRPRTIRALAGAAAMIVCLLPAASARANSSQESIFQDDLLLVGSGASVRESTLDELQSLGVDTIRVFVPWAQVAPDATSTVRPAGFDGADPSAYPAGAWSPFDELVRSVAARGLSIILTPTSPNPAWASHCGGSVSARQSCRPDPGEFGQFVRALGTRFAGGSLPRVGRWGLFNEANVGRWLTPQWVRRGGRTIPASPEQYRNLAYAAISALRDTGHGADQILLGETAPIGYTGGSLARRPVATAEFWRDLLCIDRAGRRLGGRAAVEQGCRGAQRLEATAIAHHPYVRGGSRSPLTPARSDEITISSISRLKTILRRGARQGMVPGGLPLYYTEYGFQSNPPDRTLGVPLNRMAAYLDQSEWIAYRDGAVRGLAQYLLRDDPQLGGFQSGLEFLDGRAKPALDAYRLPIWVVRHGVSVTVFGRVRPTQDRGQGTVRIQLRLPGHRAFSDFLSARPTASGFFLVRHWSRRATWRVLWEAPGGAADLVSRVAHESSR